MVLGSFLITWHRFEFISEEMVFLSVDMSILSKVGMKLVPLLFCWMIFEMWWALNNDFLCLIVKLTDFCVFHSQRRVAVKKYLFFRVDLLLCGLFFLSCLFFSLYLDFFFLFFSVVLSFFVLEVLKEVYLIEEMLMVQELNKEVYQIEETQMVLEW